MLLSSLVHVLVVGVGDRRVMCATKVRAASSSRRTVVVCLRCLEKSQTFPLVGIKAETLYKVVTHLGREGLGHA